MTISEIRQQLRLDTGDDGPKKKRPDSYYNQFIITAIGDLEVYMGTLAIREDSYQFIPIRDINKNIIYSDEAETIPEIDSEIFYSPEDPEEADTHIPVDIIVNKGLSVASGKAWGSIETADFLNEFGIRIKEEDMAFIKIDADISGEDETNTIEIDISLDDRESWLDADYSYDLALISGTTNHIDVSRIPSTYIALKWKLTGSAVKVKNTTFWRYYIKRDSLRKYALDVIELSKMRIYEKELHHAIENQNDPLVINGLQQQIQNIRQKYGLNKNAGDVKPLAGGMGISYFPKTREESKIFGYSEKSEDLLSDKRIVGITSTGEIRRT